MFVILMMKWVLFYEVVRSMPARCGHKNVWAPTCAARPRGRMPQR